MCACLVVILSLTVDEGFQESESYVLIEKEEDEKKKKMGGGKRED